jgi:hypothetical protein
VDDLHIEYEALNDLVWKNVADREHRRRLCEVRAEIERRAAHALERRWHEATRRRDPSRTR